MRRAATVPRTQPGRHRHLWPNSHVLRGQREPPLNGRSLRHQRYPLSHLERVNHVDNLSKQSPLYYAARKGHLEMAKLLVEKGADVAMLDLNNKTSA